MNQNKDIGLIWEAYVVEDHNAREKPEGQPDINFLQRAKAERSMDAHNAGVDLAFDIYSLEQAQAKYKELYDTGASHFTIDGFIQGVREEHGWSEDDLDPMDE